MYVISSTTIRNDLQILYIYIGEASPHDKMRLFFHHLIIRFRQTLTIFICGSDQRGNQPTHTPSLLVTYLSILPIASEILLFLYIYMIQPLA